MLEIENKKDCCGCEACVQCCPVQCISTKVDEEGFLYPQVDSSLCIDCGLCESVCPAIHQSTPRHPLQVYAAKNPNDEIRMSSSSGGVFTILAEYVLKKRGVVFGVCFNEKWEVVHDFTETIDGLAVFRGSKYVQSRIGDSYEKVMNFLKQGRIVLFSGTPCQIAGLRLFLRKEYANLLLVDFICHGIPSPGVFRQYLEEEIIGFGRQGDGKNIVLSYTKSLISERGGLVESNVNVEAISFRDKKKGWKKYSFALTLSKVSAVGEKNTVSLSYPLDKHPFLQGFLHNLYLRPSCHYCPAKGLKSGSDITLGDYWGIDSIMPELDDDHGISAVTVNTEKGRLALCSTTAVLYPTSWSHLCSKNHAIVYSTAIPDKRSLFFTNSNNSFQEKIKKMCRPTFKVRILRFAHTLLGKCGKKIVKKLLGGITYNWYN
jgi:NAD-dependent dihydropyrimidine dehydrogenase PreA subunit